MAKNIYCILILLSTVCWANKAYSQNIPYHINLDTSITNTIDSASFYVKNPIDQTLHINSIRTLTSKFFTRINSLSLNPFDSALVWVLFRTNQNITYYDFIIFESEELNYSIINYLIATAKYPDALYSFTQGLNDEPLKTALRNFCSTNTNNNYTASRTAMFSTIDDYNNDDTIECVYTGRKVYTTGIPSVNPPQSMNTEHTFPQSFFNENEPMRSDIHHLFPSDEVANSRRSNLDFGFVVSNITWQNAGSMLGLDYENQLVFESRDHHKGNIARCLFYFLIRYQNHEGYMDAKQEKVLREWSMIDVVDDHERIRNNGIQAFQNNRSPFVDHPEIVERIKSTFSVIPNISKPEISASPFNVRFDTLAVNDTASYLLSIFNHGTGNLNINSLTSSSPQFIVKNFPATVPANDLRFAKIKFQPNQLNQTFTSTLTIDNNDSIITVNLTGYSNNTIGVTTITQQIPVKYSLYQNYPNPFNPTTKIRFDVPSMVKRQTSSVEGGVKLIIYNSLGKEILSLVNGYLIAGSYEVNFDATNYPSGVYYYKIFTNDFEQTKRMMLIK